MTVSETEEAMQKIQQRIINLEKNLEKFGSVKSEPLPIQIDVDSESNIIVAETGYVELKVNR